MMFNVFIYILSKLINNFLCVCGYSEKNQLVIDLKRKLEEKSKLLGALVKSDANKIQRLKINQAY